MREASINLDPRGAWVVWEEPIEGAEYCLGGDTAQSATRDSDYCAAQILRRLRGRGVIQVAQYREHVEPYTFGEIAAAWGARYNNAIINIERNMGHGTLMAVQNTGYPPERLYIPMQEAAVKEDIQARIWTHTTSSSKKFLVDTLNDYMQRGMCTLRSDILLMEMEQISKDQRNSPTLHGKDITVALLMAVIVDATSAMAMPVEARPEIPPCPYNVDPELWKMKYGDPKDRDIHESNDFGQDAEFTDMNVGGDFYD